MDFIKFWFGIMLFQYNPHNEGLFAMVCWAGMLGGLLFSLYMTYDVWTYNSL